MWQLEAHTHMPSMLSRTHRQMDALTDKHTSMLSWTHTTISMLNKHTCVNTHARMHTTRTCAHMHAPTQLVQHATQMYNTQIHVRHSLSAPQHLRLCLPPSCTTGGIDGVPTARRIGTAPPLHPLPGCTAHCHCVCSAPTASVFCFGGHSRHRPMHRWIVALECDLLRR